MAESVNDPIPVPALSTDDGYEAVFKPLELQMLDITKDPIEIASTAHYSMGGLWVRSEDHSTDIDGLYAIGEAASGLHGANRIGGNSLIELLVYGRIVGEAAAAYSAGLQTQRRCADALAVAPGQLC
jgi:succinate dehydrogenase / fumarate reductase, flavoprotein subunit